VKYVTPPCNEKLVSWDTIAGWLFSRLGAEVDELALSVGDTIGSVLSEHPNITNAKLAISNRAQERIFMAIPFLRVCGMVNSRWELIGNEDVKLPNMMYAVI
jgi:hypothetical protein